MKNLEDAQNERKERKMNTRKMFTAIALLGATMSLTAAPTRTGASSQDDNQPLESPLGIGLLPPSAQFPEQTCSVTGFRLNLLAGHHCDVFALDIGTFVNIADGDMFGLEVAGIYNQIGSSSGSLQIAGLANTCSGTFGGVQIAGILNTVGGYGFGGQIAGMNNADSIDGVQIGVLCKATGKITGGQVGVLNQASEMLGVQIGVVNLANNMTGVQLGVINVINNSHYGLVFCPLMNMNF